MSYSTLKKALQIFEEPIKGKNPKPQKAVKNTPSCTKKSKRKSQHVNNIFKVQNYLKSDTGKSVKKLKEQIKNDKELNLVQINLDRLHKFDRTSCVNNIGSNLIMQRLVNLPSETSKSKKEDQTVFTDEDFEKFEREYFQN